MRVAGARVLVEGRAEGPAVVLDHPISPLGDVDQGSGILLNGPGKGTPLAGSVLVLPMSVGSSVGSYVIYGLRRRGIAPSAVLVRKPDITLVSGCALAGIPIAALADGYEGVAKLLSGCRHAEINASFSTGLDVSCSGG